VFFWSGFEAPTASPGGSGYWTGPIQGLNGFTTGVLSDWLWVWVSTGSTHTRGGEGGAPSGPSVAPPTGATAGGTPPGPASGGAAGTQVAPTGGDQGATGWSFPTGSNTCTTPKAPGAEAGWTGGNFGVQGASSGESAPNASYPEPNVTPVVPDGAMGTSGGVEPSGASPGGLEMGLTIVGGMQAAGLVAGVARAGLGGVLGAGGRVVIGENMARVRAYARQVGAETFEGTGMAANRAWIQKARAEGKEIIDIGPDFGRRLERQLQGATPGSPFYEMERREVGEAAVKVFERSGKFQGGVPGLDY
jgi:hypothetical protein